VNNDMQKDIALNQAITKIKTILTDNYLVHKHDVKENTVSESPKIEISLGLHNFVQNTSDLTQLLNRVSSEVPRGWGVSLSIRMEF